MNIKTRKIKHGGHVIGSGGFGCIFKPALKCKTQKNNLKKINKRDTGKITKLMTVKHATKEYNEIQKFNKILSTINNYKKYFLISDLTLCEPYPLSQEDLINYKKKCKALNKKDITEGNINNNLDEVLALNMPYGGKDLGTFLESNLSHKELIKLNNSLVDLLSYGILPMNNLHLYHCDIKDSNILVEKYADSSLYTRIIDWGLSTEYNKEHKIPDILSRRPLQFNVPFSIILFNNEFIEHYSKFLKKYKTPDYSSIRVFVINYLFLWINIRGEGHLKLMNEIMCKLFYNELPVLNKNKRKKFIEYEFTYFYIIDYLAKILEKYTYNEEFHLYEYFNEVFIKNIDIWGFVMIYLPIIEKIFEKYYSITLKKTELFKSLKFIIVHFLFECPVDRIDTTSLINELTKINKYITG